jgi:hypothetical protein
MIYINERPKHQPTGMLHTVIAKKTDSESIDWLEKRGIQEAWIYTNIMHVRVMSWYEAA